jgi:hypothetical protein
MLTMFVTSIYKPDHIREELITIFVMFGKHGFTESDQLLLKQWCLTLAEISTHFLSDSQEQEGDE